VSLTAGVRLGPYEILAPLGAGGMGEVYQARDERLHRDVAIKVLPPAFSQDPERLERFEREARAVAAINHPNILAVYDIGTTADLPGHAGATTYLVMELLDGETLRARLSQGPLSTRKAIDVATDLARGLAAAHDRGIVHRDLKPENVVLTRDGHVKILDFGLAKQSVPHARAADQPTMAHTEAGVVMGTVGYMAPEQVRGDAVDPRTDLFALGVVVFEMATGRRPFDRPTAAETMTAILREDAPELPAAPANGAGGLDRLVRHALDKDPRDRFQSARDFAFALQAARDPGSTSAELPAAAASLRPRVRGREIAAWIAAGALGVAAVTSLLWHRTAASSAGTPAVFTVELPGSDATLTSPSISPDGTSVAFIASNRTGDAIWIRHLGSSRVQPIGGTAGARPGGIFWSPDGTSLGFFAGGRLRTVELSAGRVDELADAPSGYGGAWGRDGTILFSPDERSPIYKVNARGGSATAATTLDASQKDQAHRWPAFLPDGRHFVFASWNSGTTTREIRVAAFDGAAPRTLFRAESGAIVSGNHFFYVQDHPSRLLTRAFNPDTLQLEGQPEPVVDDDNIDFSWFTGDPRLSASAGALIYTTGKFRMSQLTWFSRAGQPLSTVGNPDVYYDPAISADGRMLAVEKRESEQGSTDLWTVDLARTAFSRLTSDPGFESTATWSPDGQRIAFSSDQNQGTFLFVKDASGTGAAQKLVDRRAYPLDWSHDGKFILFLVDGGDTRSDIWVYDVERKTSKPVLASPFNELDAHFSPDGHWIAYVSDETHRHEVYVQSFPDGARRFAVSGNGGDQPEWRRDGKELFYLGADSTLMAVPVIGSGPQLTVGGSQPLFRTMLDPTQVIRNEFAASLDGQRFLVMSPVNPHASSLVVVLNWASPVR
jgi:Tol biopolymer transport system component